MTLVEVADTLPWGLHDAYIEALDIDWLAARLTLTVRVMITEHQDMDQRARIIVEDAAKGYTPIPAGGLWISDGAGAAQAGAMPLPPTPDGCFLHWFYVGSWNRFIHVCGREARLGWLEPCPVPSRARTRALFPGEDVPDASARRGR